MYFTVPCGKCRECVSRKRDDWLVRLYYEWLSYQSQGETIFITLTYNDYAKPFISFADMDLLSLSDYASYVVQHARYPDESKFYDRQNHIIEYYESRFDMPFPVSHYDFISDFGECVDRFDKKSVSDFVKSLRQYMHTRNIYSYDEQKEHPIKYFVTSEYGSDKHRQHYHFLLFLPKKFDVMDFKNWCEFCWSDKLLARNYPDFVQDVLKRLKDNTLRLPVSDRFKDVGSICYEYSTPNGKNWKDWIFVYNVKSKRWTVHHLKGFCMYSKDNPPVIESYKGIEYIVKYLHKADAFLNEDRFLRLKLWLSLFPATSTVQETNKHLFNALTRVRDIFPFYLSSQGLGNSLFEELKDMSETDLVNYFSNNKPIAMLNNDRTFAVPQYIINRLFYNGVDVPLVDNKVRMLTERGYKCICNMFDIKLFSLASSFAEQVQVARHFMSENDINSYFANTGRRLDSVLKLVPDFKALAHYHLVWQNVSPKVDDSTKRLWSSYDFFRHSRIMYFEQKSNCFDYESSLKGFSYVAMQQKSSRCFNFYPAFENFDLVLDAISYIRQCIGVREARNEFVDETKVNQYREKLKSWKYE